MVGKGSLKSKGNGGNDLFHHQNLNINIILFFLSLMSLEEKCWVHVLQVCCHHCYELLVTMLEELVIDHF
jgi:hypothetical protein